MFTGVAVAQRVERGRLRFTDRIGKYVPELRAAAAPAIDLLLNTLRVP